MNPQVKHSLISAKILQQLHFLLRVNANDNFIITFDITATK